MTATSMETLASLKYTVAIRERHRPDDDPITADFKRAVALIERQAAEIERLRSIIGDTVWCRCGSVVPLDNPVCDCVRIGTPETQSLKVYDTEAHDYIREQRAEIERLRAGAWRPIDDEAKRADEILAYSEHGGTGTMLCRWIAMVDFLTDSEVEEFIRQGASADMLETPDWFYADFLQGDRLSPDCYPTHYMPVPLAADSQGGEG